MKKTSTFLLVILVVASLAIAPEAIGQEAPKTPTQAEADAMMKKMVELGSPGEGHKKLDHLVGSWDVEMKTWMAGEGAGPATTSKGSAKYGWVLDGRYLRQDFEGEMMGNKMTGFGLTGYDNHAKRYVSMWVDNMSTTVQMMDGHFDRNGKVLTMYGKMDEWVTGEIGKTVKYVTRVHGMDKHVFEIHDPTAGEPNTKFIEVTYIRKK